MTHESDRPSNHSHTRTLHAFRAPPPPSFATAQNLAAYFHGDGGGLRESDIMPGKGYINTLAGLYDVSTESLRYLYDALSMHDDTGPGYACVCACVCVCVCA